MTLQRPSCIFTEEERCLFKIQGRCCHSNKHYDQRCPLGTTVAPSPPVSRGARPTRLLIRRRTRLLNS
jgi:hypothetical protein